MLTDDEKELDPMYLPDVMPCRGRNAGKETLVDLGFTLEELDAISDMPDFVTELLKTNRPGEEAEEILRERIRAARILKYGH